MGATGEQKTKPCQHSVKVMREAGIKPDLLFCIVLNISCIALFFNEIGGSRTPFYEVEFTIFKCSNSKISNPQADQKLN